MTVPTRPVGTTEGPPGFLARRVPELVGALVSVLIVGIVVGAGPFGAGATRSEEPSPVGSPTPDLTPEPTSPVDVALVNLIATVNDQLAVTGGRLAALAGTAPFPTADVATAVRELNATARSALELIPQLARQPGAMPVADRLSAFYESLRTTATAGLQASVTNAAAYARTASALALTLEELPALQAELQALLLIVPGSPEPSDLPGATPTPGPTASPTPRASDVPSGSPQASPSIGPTPPNGGPELVADGGFDAGPGGPWSLALDAGVSASLGFDDARFASPPTAARVSISTTTTSRGAIALQQSGIAIAAGATYLLRVTLSASEPREVLLRVTSIDGVTYGARVVVAGPSWVIHELPFSAPIGDPQAVLSIELGRSTATTWLDDVSLREVFEPALP